MFMQQELYRLHVLLDYIHRYHPVRRR